MTPVSITSSGQKILSSGSFITYDDGENLIEFDYDNRKNYILIRFASNSSPQESTTGYEIVDGRLVVTFYNFESNLGTANTEPHVIGEFGKRPLSWRYQVYKIGVLKSRLVHYTLYLGAK
jgi:hypothetical protein